jgi:hypothetical protein
MPSYKKKSVAFSPKVNYTDEQSPLVAEVSANFCGETVLSG